MGGLLLFYQHCISIYIYIYIFAGIGSILIKLVCIWLYIYIDFLNDHCVRISISGCLAVCELEHGPFIDGL